MRRFKGWSFFYRRKFLRHCLLWMFNGLPFLFLHSPWKCWHLIYGGGDIQALRWCYSDSRRR
ncbi:hypothetical protein B9Y56_05740 [Stenotrophomonas maltophilia]|nr:hypothetical protein B9Y56_05740 [Stenotrophomonas maltophilia]